MCKYAFSFSAIILFTRVPLLIVLYVRPVSTFGCNNVNFPHSEPNKTTFLSHCNEVDTDHTLKSSRRIPLCFIHSRSVLCNSAPDFRPNKRFAINVRPPSFPLRSGPGRGSKRRNQSKRTQRFHASSRVAALGRTPASDVSWKNASLSHFIKSYRPQRERCVTFTQSSRHSRCAVHLLGCHATRSLLAAAGLCCKGWGVVGGLRSQPTSH